MSIQLLSMIAPFIGARAESWEYAARSATCVGFSTYAARRAPIATRHLSSSWLPSIPRCAD